MNDRLAALELFIRVARTGSFTGGGRELQIPQSSVSRTISKLERHVGAALFTRTTRAVSLTEAGAAFLARIEPLVAALEDAESSVRAGGALRGTLRVGLSSSFAIRMVVPRLPRFVAHHPLLHLELITVDQRQDLVGEGIDVGLRLGILQNSTATSRRILSSPRIVAASPAYLANSGVPEMPADLSAHAMILGPPGSINGMTFHRSREEATVRKADARLSTTMNEVAIALAVAGLGIVTTTQAGCQRELDDGRLVRVLPDWTLGTVEVHAVFPAGRAAKPSARAFVDFLAQELEPTPPKVPRAEAERVA